MRRQTGRTGCPRTTAQTACSQPRCRPSPTCALSASRTRRLLCSQQPRASTAMVCSLMLLVLQTYVYHGALAYISVPTSI